mgnify:FL=1
MDENVKDNKVVDFPVKENINSNNETEITNKNEKDSGNSIKEQIKLAELVNVASRLVIE